MLNYEIPGREALTIEHLVLDYNGTLAVDGALVEGVAERLMRLRNDVHIHVITADTFGSVKAQLASTGVTISILEPDNQDRQKADYVGALGAKHVIAIGNGMNDGLLVMLQRAILGVALVQVEGAAVGTVMKADVIFTSINDALDALLKGGRLKATLRC